MDYSDDEPFNPFNFWERIDKARAQRRAEFEKLACEPGLKEAVVGDRVLVAGGPAGMGFEWVRIEGVVTEVADTAYRILFKDRFGVGKDSETWLHRFCVTDVLGPKPTEGN